jgi:hypothetical protein
MDSGKAVFKTEDVDALAEEIVGLDISSIGLSPDEEDSEDKGAKDEGSEMDILLAETGEITLEPDEEEENTTKPAPPGPDDMELDLEPDQNQKESEGGFGLSQMGDLTMADTNVGTVGINILSGTGDAYKLTEDTKAETSAQGVEDVDELESLDADANLESFGSGSGLLDLSLQADDTSLGAVLDDILPAGAEEGGVAAADMPVDEIGLAGGTEDLLGNEQAEEIPAEATTPMGAEPVAIPSAAPTVMAVDSKSAVFGVMMFLPLLALIAASIVLTAAIQNVMPALMKPLVEMEMAGISLVWIIVGGLTVLLLIILMFAAVGGSGGGTKIKKIKTKKEKKPKKAKKAKKKRK